MHQTPRRFTIHFSRDVEEEFEVRFTGPMDRIVPEDLYDIEVEFEDEDGEIVTMPLFASIEVHEPR
ncbi:MAG: hypothetical protein JJ896_16275 [Rhodothermales bacterium]|nr:hypothetical protein [Rhodothermales bacterium]MBO6781213.1 hypothetical protein [Rhodothermales bacterium]